MDVSTSFATPPVTAMPMIAAVGTSLVSVAAFGATTGINYALSGLVDLRIAALFIVGGVFVVDGGSTAQ